MLQQIRPFKLNLRFVSCDSSRLSGALRTLSPNPLSSTFNRLVLLNQSLVAARDSTFVF